MAQKSHKLLTGTDLHEPKGIEAASDGEVYVAAGTGTGSWKPMPFSGSFIHVREEQTGSTSSGTTLSNGSWVDRVLNVLKTDNVGVVLGANELTLAAGTYTVFATAAFVTASDAGNTNAVHKLRLRNITDGATLIAGIPVYQPAQSSAQPPRGGLVELHGQFTITGARNIALQHYAAFTGSATGGQAVADGETQVYTDVLLWKIS